MEEEHQKPQGQGQGPMIPLIILAALLLVNLGTGFWGGLGGWGQVVIVANSIVALVFGFILYRSYKNKKIQELL